MRVLVAGGGFSGLLAARRLRVQGFEVEVWEASGRPGGWVWTEAWPGKDGGSGALEWGPQELRFRPGDALDRLVQDLGLRLRPSPSRDPRWILRGGRCFPQPRSPLDLLLGAGLSLESRLRLFLEPLLPIRPAADLASLLAYRLGRSALHELAEPLLASLVPRPLAEVGLEAIPGLPAWRGSLSAFVRAQAGLRAWVPEGGLGAVAQTLATDLGPGLRLGCPVQGLARTAEGWEARSPGGEVRFDRVVLALPPASAAAVLEPVAPEAAGRVRAVPCADLLCWHSRHPGPNPWPRGFHLAVAPGEAPPVLGVISLGAADDRAAEGALQLRTYGAGDAADAWPGVEAWLRTRIPGLGPAEQFVVRPAPQGFAVPAPGHGEHCAEVDRLLPAGLAWTGSGRLGAGLGALAEGFPEGWNPFVRGPLL